MKASEPKRVVVVTGTSSGMGLAIVEALVDRGFYGFGSVRKQSDADRLSKAFPESSFKPIVFDVCDQPAVLRAVAVVRSKLQNQHLFGIVNNAGIGLCGPSALVPIEDVRQMLETNLVGPLIVSQAFIPLLGGEKSLQGVPGRIVQVSSMAATLSVPWGGLYCASKSALEAMTASMRRELNIYGISTSIVRPGSVPTALQAKVDLTRYDGTDFEFGSKFIEKMVNASQDPKLTTPPKRIAAIVSLALTVPNPKLVYNVHVEGVVAAQHHVPSAGPVG